MSKRTRWLAMVFVFTPSIASCADEPLLAPTVSESQVAAAVTPGVAAMLDGDGRFVFGEPAPADVPWITSDRARELAVGYWTGYGSTLRPALVERRKAGIAIHIAPCRRVFLAESGYDAFPAGLAREYRRAFGATWIVSLCSGGEQQVAIAVSVEATDLTIDELGIVRGVRSGDFYSEGVPVGTNFPVDPELGAVGVAETVSSRVSALPRYRRLADRYNPFSGIWTYEIESSVRLRGDRSGIDVDTNVVDFSRWASVRDLRPVMANQDSAGKSRSEIFAQSTDGVAWTNVEVFRRVDTPVSLETFAIGVPRV